jgi:hypothetical protein
MSDEAVPSRSYVVKQGGFTDPIVDAVMNLGRASVSGYQVGWLCWACGVLICSDGIAGNDNE